MGYTYGRRWSDEMIENEILKVKEGLNLDHFPTHSEMNDYTGNRALSLAISRHGGTVKWAEKMKLQLKESETVFGDKYEIYAIDDILNNTGFSSIQTNSRHAYDILVNKCVKIDVKASMKNILRSNNAEYYTFNLEKKEPTCDIFILYCIDDNMKIQKTIIIPSVLTVGKTQIGIGAKNSKWDRYINQWKYIEEYNNFFKKYQE